MKSYQEKCTFIKKKLKEFMDDLKEKVDINENNINIILDLMNSKIACISHNLSFRRRDFAINQHYDRKQFREHLRDFVKKDLKNFVKGGKDE